MKNVKICLSSARFLAGGIRPLVVHVDGHKCCLQLGEGNAACSECMLTCVLSQARQSPVCLHAYLAWFAASTAHYQQALLDVAFACGSNTRA